MRIYKISKKEEKTGETTYMKQQNIVTVYQRDVIDTRSNFDGFVVYSRLIYELDIYIGNQN